MAQQEWISPYSPAQAPGPSATALRFELRPLTTGEVLDRTFSLYRSHFWLFVGLGSVTAGIAVLGNALRLVVQHFSGSIKPQTMAWVAGGIGIVQILLGLAAYTQTQAATVSGVHALYLGESTTILAELKKALKHWPRYIGIAFWQAWSAVWVATLLAIPMATIYGLGIKSMNWLVVLLGFGIFAAFIYGIIAYIRNALAVPAAVVEDRGVRAAIQRSKQLVAGRKFRIFLLLLLVYILYVIAIFIETPILAVIGYRTIQHSNAGTTMLMAVFLVVNFIVTSLVGPVLAIGTSLFYIDERVRREGFDIEFLLQASSKTAPVAAPPPQPFSSISETAQSYASPEQS